MSLKSDWKVATGLEKVRFVMVTGFMVALGVTAIYLLLFLWDDKVVITSEMKRILFSYAAFMGVIALKGIRLKPKKAMGVSATKSTEGEEEQ